jgi:aminoglycoside/choline kinase family phosphotransferase
MKITEKQIVKALSGLFKKYFYEFPATAKRINGGVSGRIIFRLSSRNYTCIGVHNKKIPENRAFIEFSYSLLNAGLRVPQIYCVSENNEYYLEEFLGYKSLFELTKDKIITGKEKIKLYRQALSDLVLFQVKGKDAINYRYCYETKSFSRKQIYYDIGRCFEYYINKLTSLKLSKREFLSIRKILSDRLKKEKNKYFMYRDFQPRNIMFKDGELSYIDYQSGRKGQMQYDVASFLYSGSIHINESQRKGLLDYYIKEAARTAGIKENEFRENYYYFVLIRLIQLLGSYGYLYSESKNNIFISKMEKAIENIKSITKYLEDEVIKKFAQEISRYPIRTSKNQ